MHYFEHLKKLKQKILSKKYSFDTDNISALSGATSRLVFLAHLGKVEGDKAEIEKWMKKDLEALLDQIENNQVGTNYLEGLAGFGVAAQQVLEMGYLPDLEQQVLELLDPFLLQSVQADFNDNLFDLFYGGFGHLQYVLNRPNLVETYKNDLAQLLESSIFEQILVRDFSFLDDDFDGTIDFSISHGLASIIYFLNRLYEKGIAQSKCLDYLKICCQFICGYITPTETGMRIPDYIDGETPRFSPLRWCHGELGIVIALTRANRNLKDVQMNDQLSEVVKTIAGYKLTPEQSIVSANICHGTLGVAHLFGQLYKDYPFSEVEVAKAYWYQKSDELMRSQIGYTDKNAEGNFVEKTGVLTGIEGMGLAVLSYCYPNNCNWDHQLLLQ